MAKYESHYFYCLNCGKKSIPIMRKIGHQHGKNHRKALYCPFCKQTVNHMEVKTFEEAIQFREDFNKGIFKEEAKESILYIKQNAKEIL